MNKKLVLTLLVIPLMLLTPSLSVLDNTDGNVPTPIADETGLSEPEIEYSLPVPVSDGAKFLTIGATSVDASSVSEDHRIISNIPSQINEHAVLISDNWFENNTSASNALIEKLMESGKVVISLNPEVFTNAGTPLDSYSFPENTDGNRVYMMYIDARTNTSYCYTRVVYQDTTENVQTSTVQPSDNQLNDGFHKIAQSYDSFVDIITTNESAPLGSDVVERSVYSILDVECGSDGTFSVNSRHMKLKDIDPDYNYYLSEYHITTVPSKDLRGTADITITSTDFSTGSRLFRFEPNTTNGVTSSGFTLGPDIILGGLSYSRSYETPDVIVHNQCDPSKGLYKIWHDVDETANVGRDTYFVEPTKLVIIDNTDDGSYSSTDTYEVDFARLLGFGSNIVITPVYFKSYSETVSVHLG